MNRFPLFRCIVLYISGIILSKYLACEPNIVCLLISTCLLLASCIIAQLKRRNTGIVISFMFLLFGFTQYQLQSPKTIQQQLEKSQQKKATFQVLVLEKSQHKPTYIKVKAKIIGSSINNLMSCSVLLKIKDTKAPKVGDLISLEGKLFPLPSPPLAGQFDYASYLKQQGISYQLQTNHWQLLKSSTKFSLVAFAANCQDYLFGKLKKMLKNKNAIGLAAAVLLGNKDALDPSLKKAFQEAGAIHMLAVSGMHTGILFMVLCFVFRVKPTGFKPQIIKKFIILILLWFFALLTGFNPGVVRACTMFSLVILSAIIKRNNELFHHLCLSCLLMLLYNSTWLFDIGFQLSYAALIGIALLQKPLALCVKSKYKVVQYFISLISVSIAAQLSCLPFILYYFHSFPTYFLLSNLILLPFLPLLVYGGMFLLFLDAFSIEITILYTFYESILIYFNKAVVWIASLAYSATKPIYPSISQTLILILIIYLSSLTLIKKRFKLLKYTFLLCILIQVENLYHKHQTRNHKFLLLHNNRASTFYYISNGYAHSILPTNNAYEKKMIHQFFESKGIQLSRNATQEYSNTHNEMHTEHYTFIWWDSNYDLTNRNQAKKSILILSKNTPINMDHLHLINPIMILADRSNSNESIVKWEKEFQKANIAFYAAKKKPLWIELE